MTPDPGTSCTAARGPLLARRLRTGDTIAVCSPSAPGAPIASARFERGLEYLRRQGHPVRVGAQAWATGHAAGPARARAAELNEALRDPSVRMIVTAIGGYNTNGILKYLDYDALAADPKIIVGYSDITALLLAVYARTGLVTFHGPTVMTELAEFPEPLDHTADALWRAVGKAEPLGPLQPPSSWTEEFLMWGERDHEPRRQQPHPGWEWLHGGSAAGPLLGGNLETLCALAGTAYLPAFTHAVFFWESCSHSLGEIERGLDQLESAGITEGIAGMVVGRSFRGGEEFEKSLRRYLAERYAGAGHPVLAGVDLGHTDPMATLPLGVQCSLDAGTEVFEVTQAAVRE